MTRAICAALALLPALALAAGVRAQPVDLPIPPATTDQYPPGVHVARTAQGPVYVDKAGLTLYGMDMRTLVRWSPDPAQHCQGACAGQWQPLLAPADAKPNIAFPSGFGAAQLQQQASPTRQPRPPGGPALPPGFVTPQKAPDWTIIAGPQGPQWVYKGWHMAFVRKGARPGSTAFDGADERTWNTLKFVPPVAKVDAPDGIVPLFVDGGYALADASGRVLFTGRCKADCVRWTPMTGGMASHGMGLWTVGQDGDQPQWRYRGQPVFISQEDDPARPPAGGKALRP